MADFSRNEPLAREKEKSKTAKFRTDEVRLASAKLTATTVKSTTAASVKKFQESEISDGKIQNFQH